MSQEFFMRCRGVIELALQRSVDPSTGKVHVCTFPEGAARAHAERIIHALHANGINLLPPSSQSTGDE
jgi:hypothetical protein